MRLLGLPWCERELLLRRQRSAPFGAKVASPTHSSIVPSSHGQPLVECSWPLPLERSVGVRMEEVGTPPVSEAEGHEARPAEAIAALMKERPSMLDGPLRPPHGAAGGGAIHQDSSKT